MLSLPTKDSLWVKLTNTVCICSGSLKWFSGLDQTVSNVESSSPAFMNIAFWRQLCCTWVLRFPSYYLFHISGCNNTESVTNAVQWFDWLAGGTGRLDPADNRHGGRELWALLVACLFLFLDLIGVSRKFLSLMLKSFSGFVLFFLVVRVCEVVCTAE